MVMSRVVMVLSRVVTVIPGVVMVTSCVVMVATGVIMVSSCVVRVTTHVVFYYYSFLGAVYLRDYSGSCVLYYSTLAVVLHTHTDTVL